jgi:hypothetical protein
MSEHKPEGPRMARYSFLLLVALVAAGCQQAMIAAIPAPNFSGPVIAPPVAAAPQAAPQPWTPSPSVGGGVAGDAQWKLAVRPRQWKWIVIHHSATPSGSAVVFDRMHRQKGWDELGYHFVIGNGTDSRDGQVEVGPRWPKQKWGAHAKTPDNRFNDYGIGICLVGNFDIERPTQRQLKSLARLTAYLMQTYKIPASNVLGHRDCKPTDCPGRNMNIALVRSMAQQTLADAGEPTDEIRTAGATIIPTAELLKPVTPATQPVTEQAD